ncbi:MAG TPA: hypothetical protein EYP57_00490 [Thermodesulfobacteriaceae bacterium]|nr:hypothetical protein [Thermodesulfobacteriaceae bacterium]
MTGQDEKIFISALREGVELVQLIVFMKLKENISSRYPDAGRNYVSMLAGAVVNRLFGSEHPEERFAGFARENSEAIDKELGIMAEELEDLRIPVTDALRMHFFCNRHEGTGSEEDEIRILEQARDTGMLIKDRSVPWPRGFMELVYRVGRAYGLLRPQETGTD